MSATTAWSACGSPTPAAPLRLPVERERRLLEQALAASLTGEERAHLVSALTKIHRAAAGILAAAGTAEAARDELSRTASW